MFELANSPSISEPHLAPFSMSEGVKYGFTNCRTPGSHCLKASASLLLKSPDQLMKTLVATLLLLT